MLKIKQSLTFDKIMCNFPERSHFFSQKVNSNSQKLEKRNILFYKFSVYSLRNNPNQKSSHNLFPQLWSHQVTLYCSRLLVAFVYEF